MTSNLKKQKDQEFGRFAEQLAADYYTKRGYAIRERNWRMNKIEIDLIVQKEDTVVFVEVKARSGEDEDAVNAVTPDKMRRMIRASESYIRELQGNIEYRYDIVGVTGDIKDYEIEVLQDAFLAADFF